MPNENFPVPETIKDPYSVPIYLDKRLLLLALNPEVLENEDRLNEFHESFFDLIYPLDISENQNFKNKPQIHEPLNYRWYFINEGVDLNNLNDNLKNHVDNSGKVVNGVSYAYYSEGYRDEPEHYKAPLPNTFVIKLKKGASETEKKGILEFLRHFNGKFCEEKSALLSASSPNELLYFYVPEASLDEIIDIKDNLDEFGNEIDSIHLEYIPLKSPFSYYPLDPHYRAGNGWNMQAVFAGSGEISADGAPIAEEGCDPEELPTCTGWDISRGSPEITIAIIDDGVNLHEDLVGYNGEGCRFQELNESCTLIESGLPVGNAFNHGTQVAGIALATIDNDKGIAGMAGNCKLLSLNMSTGSWVELVCSLNKAIDNEVHVINMSFEAFYEVNGAFEIDCYFNPSEVNPVIERAYNEGIVICAASGNDTIINPIGYPACHPKIIAVGASQMGTNDPCIPPGHPDYPSTQRLHRVSQSVPINFYDPVDPPDPSSFQTTRVSVVAPGESIYTTNFTDLTTIGTSYEFFSQTSAATPHVSDLAALILSVNRRLSPKKVRSIIEDTADRILVGADEEEEWQGNGQINVFKALLAAYRTKSFLGFLIPESVLIERIKSEMGE